MTLANEVTKFIANSDIVHQVVHGDADTTVMTEKGPVRSLAKLIKDKGAEFDATREETFAAFDGIRIDAHAATTTAEAARDAAKLSADASLIQAGVYPTEELGRAAVADGMAFKVQGSGDVAAHEYRKKVSPNLFNSATARDGFYVATDGSIKMAAGWGCSAFIPVTAGQKYTLSGTRGRLGLSFFSAASDAAVVVGSYDGTGALPLTVTAPAGAAFVVTNLYSSSAPAYSNIQMEKGEAATPYTAYGTDWSTLIASYPAAMAVADLKIKVAALEKPKSYVGSLASVNLFNVATLRTGSYLDSATGSVKSAVGWGCSAFIPVEAGKKYTLSGTRGRAGLSFFSAANDAALIAGSYNASTSMPLTVTAPAGATYMAFNVYSAAAPDYSNLQLEQGAVATAYMGYGGTDYVRRDSIYPAIEAVQPSPAKLVLSSSSTPGTSYLEVPLSDVDVLKMKVTPFAANTHSSSQVWNFHSENLNDAAVKSSVDDVAPYRVFGGTTIGANHGYSKTNCTVAGHGKTLADVGSVWTDGSAQWVIVDVIDANTLSVTARTSDNGFAIATLTHVSGATNTASFTPAAIVASQWYPVIKNRTFSISVDGVPVKDFDKTYPYWKGVTFAESYEIMNKASIVEWLITQAGTATNIANYEGAADLSVSMSYVFDTSGGVTIYTDLLALNAVPQLQDIMFMQAQKMTAGALGPVRYYVPKSLPFTHESVAYDFRTLRDMTGFNVASRIDFTPARCEEAGQLVDRLIMLNDSVGMAIGYLPLQSAHPSVRRANASRKALQISEAMKVYPSCIDSAGKTSLTAGEYFSVVAYRNWFKRSNKRTSSYVVRSALGDYLYCDWHGAAVDRVPLPPDLHGRAFEVVEKSSNVTLLSQALTSSIAVKVGGEMAYGYLILKINS